MVIVYGIIYEFNDHTLRLEGELLGIYVKVVMKSF